MRSVPFRKTARLSLFVVLAFAATTPALAWTGPTASPPGGNTAAPVNVSSTGQTKTGAFGISGSTFSVTGPSAGWAAMINWPNTTAPGYGILVGTSASGYSQFENASGYYTILDNGSYGVQTNGYVLAANAFGGLFSTLTTGGCNSANPLTGGCSCPGYAPSVGQFAIGYHGSGYEYLYQCW